MSVQLPRGSRNTTMAATATAKARPAIRVRPGPIAPMKPVAVTAATNVAAELDTAVGQISDSTHTSTRPTTGA